MLKKGLVLHTQLRGQLDTMLQTLEGVCLKRWETSLDYRIDKALGIYPKQWQVTFTLGCETEDTEDSFSFYF